jgi:type III secretion protein R
MKTASPEVLLGVSLLIALVPMVLALGTCYLKFSIVLGVLRSGFGTQQAPSNSLVVALSVVLSLVVMQPVMREVAQGVSSLELSQLHKLPLMDVAAKVFGVAEPWRRFLMQHASQRELEVFAQLAGHKVEDGSLKKVERADVSEPSLSVCLGAFVLSEVRRGFVMALFLLIPFFVIDVVVSNLLVSLGLTMLSPVVVTLPLKLLLFISSDGWLLLSQKMVQSYH